MDVKQVVEALKSGFNWIYPAAQKQLGINIILEMGIGIVFLIATIVLIVIAIKAQDSEIGIPCVLIAVICLMVVVACFCISIPKILNPDYALMELMFTLVK